MIKLSVSSMTLCVLLLAGCSTTNPPQEYARSAVTPESWLNFSELHFIVTDQSGESIGGIHLLTFDDAVQACGPEMLRAEIASDSTGLIPDWGYDVGYIVDGNWLRVEFGVPVCDGTYEISATLFENVGEGDFRSVSPWGGRSFGNVSVSNGPR